MNRDHGLLPPGDVGDHSGMGSRVFSYRLSALRCFFAIYFSSKVCLIHKATLKKWFYVL